MNGGGLLVWPKPVVFYQLETSHSKLSDGGRREAERRDSDDKLERAQDRDQPGGRN